MGSKPVSSEGRFPEWDYVDAISATKCGIFSLLERQSQGMPDVSRIVD